MIYFIAITSARKKTVQKNKISENNHYILFKNNGY